MNDLKKNQVNISNIAARAAHSLTLDEKRILTAAISQLDSRKQKICTIDAKNRTIRLAGEQFAETYGTATNNAYQQIIKASKLLLNRQIVYTVETPKGIKERRINWLEGATYHHGEGWIELCFSSLIVPHLFKLTKRFTQYKLEQTAALRSIYSWRLLEVLLSSSNNKEKGSAKFTLEQLKHMLEIPKSYKSNDIKKRVIEPAVKELSQKDGWIITWEPRKTGRKVTAISFEWKRDPQRDLFKD